MEGVLQYLVLLAAAAQPMAVERCDTNTRFVDRGEDWVVVGSATVPHDRIIPCRVIFRDGPDHEVYVWRAEFEYHGVSVLNACRPIKGGTIRLRPTLYIEERRKP